MEILFNPADLIDRAMRKAALEAGLSAESFDPVVRPADPRFGDYQVNGVLPYAKKAGKNPREVATALLESAVAGNLLDPALMEWSIAGPGFINFTLTPRFSLQWLHRFVSEDDLKSGAGSRLKDRVMVVDYSSPNTAKEMHVGHIRSTVIGECLSRLLSFAGATVTRDNHIGDWGTQFGMLIWAIKRKGYDLESADPDTAVAELEALYKEGHAAYKESTEQATEIREELVKLQNGDAENTRIWNSITEVSWKSFDHIYSQLGIKFDVVLGESFYRDKVDRIYEELEKTGLSEESDGAIVVFHPEHKRFAKQPFLIRKSDGASNYATTDLASVLYRVEEMKADGMLYVVDSRQADHFQQLFLTVEKWFKTAGRVIPQMEHVSFGSVLGENGKPIKTKEGGSVKLKELLAEAVSRSAAIVREKNPDLSAEEIAEVARVVGLGAIRYADLSQNRTSDYLFSWEKMLGFEGNTAPYLLYAVARIHSIFRKAGIEESATFESATDFQTNEERALSRKLLAFPSTIDLVLADLRPHILCTYLFELAGVFSSFYNANKVIVEEEDVRARRLLLCARTLTIMETGLHLLGLETLQRM
ncbi:arginine--tRNA ligase [Puniceicoccales bacterium CK1056]|uniref:Arginine--tRNA ligase n=2 Tax=Oceanipulchritudo coccoides TaxID=2706888 RepID=A0A6B2M4L4_9BACT|nr:arginine--tRNA ligase [Oceanipulchritudo coccoides]